MNKARKVDLLYKKAKGQNMDAMPEEKRELKKYHVEFGESSLYATKANISQYVTDVDNGFHRSFYDWCIDNRKADRRRRRSSEADIAGHERDQGIASIFMGWLTWGIAIYWIFHGSLEVGACAVMGAVVSICLFKFARGYVGLTVWILPLALAVIFGH